VSLNTALLALLVLAGGLLAAAVVLLVRVLKRVVEQFQSQNRHLAQLNVVLKAPEFVAMVKRVVEPKSREVAD